jgi:hypothetical protein
LPLVPRLAGSKPFEDDGFSRAIKLRNMTSFGWEVKPSDPCRKILRHVKEPFEYERDTSQAKFSISFTMFLLLRYKMTLLEKLAESSG